MSPATNLNILQTFIHHRGSKGPSRANTIDDGVNMIQIIWRFSTSVPAFSLTLNWATASKLGEEHNYRLDRV